MTIEEDRGRAGAVWVPSNPDNTSTNDPVTTTGDPAPSDNPEDPASGDNGGEWLTQDVHVDFEGYNECLPLYYQDCIKLHTCSVKDYVGGFVYIGSELEGFYFEEGRITTANENEAFQQIDFFYKDHLGSPRSIYREDTDSKGNKNGEPIVIQESHYYPFGGKLQGISPRIEEPEVTYQYNGKELTDEFGLNWTDYGARWLDVELGRWFVVDPLADHPNQIDKSPFAYGWNNPVYYTDPDGQCPKCWVTAFRVGKKAYKIYKKTGKLTPKSLKKAGLDEVVDIAGDLQTIFSGDAGLLDRFSAAADLIVGTDFNSKGNKAVSKSLGLGDNTKKVHKNSTKSKAPAQKYTIEDENGKSYHGVGDTNGKRANASKKKLEKENPDNTFTVTEQQNFPNRKEAYIEEQKGIDATGGAKGAGNYNKINSPGKKLMDDEY